MITSQYKLRLTSSDPKILFDLILDPFEKLRIYEGKLEISMNIINKILFILFLYFML